MLCFYKKFIYFLIISALQQMGYRLSPQFINFLVGKVSPGQHRITLDNFIIVNVQLRNLTDAFRMRDSQSNGTATFSYEDFITSTMMALL